VLRRFGFKATLIVTAVACGVAVAATGWFRASTPIWLMAAVLALGGLLRSQHLTATSTLAFADIPDREVSRASSFTSVVQQMSQAFGITLAGLTLSAAQVVNGPGVRPLDPKNFVLPFAAVGLCGMLSALTYLPLPRTAGSNLHGREGVKGRR
jgi:MFS family permease